MAPRYEPRPLEAKWQKIWEERGLFNAPEDPARPKYYVLEMFPYPSGRIHMGHVRNYTIGDVVARYKRMRGFNVLHPMGWDAFGLPAENAAMARGLHPAAWTYDNIAYMRRQLKELGYSYDWRRELATCDPDYYRWEQLVFIEMFRRGLAYKKEAPVNWCPKCATVLANEQVEEGLCWRCDSPVHLKELNQWFFKITAYAEELLADLDQLTHWPERVLTMQRHWIGKSPGAEIYFPLARKGGEALTVFTTRADTLFGATFMSLAPEHPLALALAQGTGQEEAVGNFVEYWRAQNRSRGVLEEVTKEGVFTGSFCINPVTGGQMPIYVANFVLMEYGTGAVMAVPAHDQRDFEFAQKYDLPIKVVIQPPGEELKAADLTAAYEDEGVLADSGQFSGMASAAAKEAIAAFLEEKGQGKPAVHFRLRDWLISRQRYWGAPIPIIYCEACGLVPVPEKDLPVVLPLDVAITGEGGSPLAQLPSFYEVACPACGGPARREVDTMDTFVESSWYFLRYACADYTGGVLDPARVNYWLPVDQYIGGIEHAVLHLLYARFFTKVLRDLGMVQDRRALSAPPDPGDGLERRGQDGQIQGQRGGPGVHDRRIRHRHHPPVPAVCGAAGEGPGVERPGGGRVGAVPAPPLEFGAGAAAGDSGGGAPIKAQGQDCPPELSEFRHKVHATIKKVTEDIEDSFHFNTAIAAVMELVNAFYLAAENRPREAAALAVFREAVEAILLLVSPMVPHIAEELWQALGHTTLVLEVPWPQPQAEALTVSTLTVVVQVNGKVRSRLEVPAIGHG